MPAHFCHLLISAVGSVVHNWFMGSLSCHSLDFCPRPAKMGSKDNLGSYFPNIYTVL